MQITPAEVRLAWSALIVLAALVFPVPPYPSPPGLAAILAAFIPGAIIVSTARGAARVTEG